jgi:predicted ATP-grasp superfamily ATP-dependent carboligase
LARVQSASRNGRPAGHRVLVTDASRGSAISIIRSLGRRGFHVVAADSLPRSPGFYSRYARDRLRYPPPGEAPDATIATLLEAARKRRVDLIVPVTDQVVLPLSDARERFAGVSTLALPEPQALASTADKLATMELARELGVPTPRTALVATADEALEAVPTLGWPVVLKPQTSSVYRPGSAVEAYKVGYAESPAGLVAQMRRFEGRCSVLLQEYCQGEGHGVELLLHRGRPLVAFQHRRLREVPITGGASSFRESVPLDPQLYDHSVRILGALDWTGLAMVEFKIGREGPVLMEVNGRIWGSLPLAIKSGVDFAARAAELYLFGPPPADVPAVTSYAVGVRSRNLDLEMLWIGSVLRGRRRYPFLPLPSRRQAVVAALRLVHPADGFDVLSREDPRPGLAELAGIAAKLRRKVLDGN